MPRGEAQRLATQLEASFVEIERLKPVYCYAIDQLETHAVPNLSAQSAGKWFELYLRVEDLGVQIRRGEIRHRTQQKFTYPCRHNTGTKGAVHSGLSIDDANAIYQLMETRELAKESRLTKWFMRIDGLDRDDVGQLDKRLSSCLDHFLGLRSAYYGRLEKSGKDPHEELFVLGETGADSAQKIQVLVKTSRQCSGPKRCTCKDDAEPWNDFSLKPGDPHTQPRSLNGVDSSSEPAQKKDVGVLDIKRQFGFEDNGDKGTDAASLARDAAELALRRKPRRVATSSGGGVWLPTSAKNLYNKKCEENGTKPKPHIHTVLTVKDGSLQLNLSQVGFHAADDLQDLVDIFSAPSAYDLPPVLEFDVANGFFNGSAFRALCHLLRSPRLRQAVERLSFRGISVPERSDFATLMRLLAAKSDDTPESLPALAQLKTLDLSFNSLNYDAVVSLRPLLASAQNLETLSLESCFPALSVFSSNEQNSTNECVRVALMEASSRLKSLNFGSNCIPVGSRWIDAIFTPESRLNTVYLYGLSSATVNSNGVESMMEVDWQAGETWDLQQVDTLKWSSNNKEDFNKFLDALSAAFQTGFPQLKALDMEVSVTSKQADGKLIDIIGLLSDYGVLRSFGLCLAHNSIASGSLRASVESLLEGGLRECEVLTLRMPQLCLTARSIRDLLSCAFTPNLRQMTIVIGLDIDAEVTQGSNLCFQQNEMQSIRELTLELHTPAENEQSDMPAIVRELETSWLALNSSCGGRERQQTHKDAFSSATGMLKYSFILSEQRKLSKRIYRCRFFATPTPI